MEPEVINKEPAAQGEFNAYRTTLGILRKLQSILDSTVVVGREAVELVACQRWVQSLVDQIPAEVVEAEGNK